MQIGGTVQEARSWGGKKHVSLCLGERLKEVRVSKGYTQIQVAMSADLDRSFISDLERGAKGPTISTLESLANVYSMTLSELLEGVVRREVIDSKVEVPELAPRNETPDYEIVTLTELPPILRGGHKAESYPFDKLTVFPAPGHAFLVPATAAKPNPAKTLASTVASATKRYAKKDGRIFTVRKHTMDGKCVGAYVIRVK